jgi:hypothetical protein
MPLCAIVASVEIGLPAILACYILPLHLGTVLGVVNLSTIETVKLSIATKHVITQLGQIRIAII